MYLEEGLTAKEIAKKLGISKSTVKVKLHLLNIRKRKKEQSSENPPKYWHRIAPYGFRIENKQLIPCKQEMKICRLVVKGVQDKKLSYRAMARELEKKGIKNQRSNSTQWGHHTIASIYKRWQGKI